MSYSAEANLVKYFLRLNDIDLINLISYFAYLDFKGWVKATRHVVFMSIVGYRKLSILPPLRPVWEIYSQKRDYEEEKAVIIPRVP